MVLKCFSIYKLIIDSKLTNLNCKKDANQMKFSF